jgi:hypothetical protein
MAHRDAPALAVAWGRLHTQLPTREATRTHAQTFSWDATTQGQLQLFQKVVDATA